MARGDPGLFCMNPMKKILIPVALFILALPSCAPSKKASTAPAKDFNWKINQLGRTGEHYVMVAAHRSDWRNAPENSMPALEKAIAMGADIAELDLKKTKDGVLVIMHDKTIDRTTSGKGKPEDFTLAEIRKFRLKNGLGRVTEDSIPTFEQYLDLAKGKIILDVDKGYDYFPDVVKMLRDKDMVEQAIINIDDNSTLDEVEQKHGLVAADLWLMPIVQCSDSAKARLLIDSYRRHRRTIYQPCWSNDAMVSHFDFAKLGREGYGIWLNSLWPSLNGGHDDDRAMLPGQAANSWGWLVDKGAAIIQTDRPVALLDYLEQEKLR
ncbi:MAG: glycerophosphodiester phosphodiesterase family protein [Chitinophagaceae bacterium]|nr:MAG: glycerophosphodiester phosphodiesterase family protein [Chitinophagaceae bacterium]